MKRTFLSRI